MLEVTGLNFHYGNVQALYDISMSMPSGQITCVMGRNGVGKTTLLKNIMGVGKQHDGARRRRWCGCCRLAREQTRP